MTSTPKIRVALLSFWHSHAAQDPEIQFTGGGVYGTVHDHPEIEIVGAWDDDPERGAAGADRLGVPFLDDLEALLSRNDIDGVVVMNETTRHRELCLRAAEHGKHIYISKVLAPTIRDARAIADACAEAGVVLVTMLSRLYEKWAQRIRAVIAGGDLGDIVNLRIWHAHGIAVKPGVDGAGFLTDDHGFFRASDGGGGSYVDMCHPQYLTPFLLGSLPTSAFARMRSVSGRGDVEDNAVVLLDYADGPYVILEEGWATAPTTTYIEVHGTDGTLLYRDDKSDPAFAFFGVRTGDAAAFSVLPVEVADDSALDEWIRHIRSGTLADDNVARALDLSRLNEAAYRSASLGRPVALTELERES